MRFWILLAVTLLVAVTVFAGNLYYWKDDSGVMRIGERPPQQGMKSPGAGKTTAKQGKEQSAGKIEIFVTDSCPYCKHAIKYLQKKGVPFTVHNVGKDKRAAERMLKLSRGGRAVPFAMIYGTPVTGFSPEVYDQALAAKP